MLLPSRTTVYTCILISLGRTKFCVVPEPTKPLKQTFQSFSAFRPPSSSTVSSLFCYSSFGYIWDPFGHPCGSQWLPLLVPLDDLGVPLGPLAPGRLFGPLKSASLAGRTGSSVWSTIILMSTRGCKIMRKHAGPGGPTP